MPFAGAGESTGAFSESGDTHLCPREMTHQRAFLSHTGAFHFARNSRTISAISGSLGLLDCIKQQIRKLRSTKSLVSLHVQSHCQ